jgi:competence protein ComEA
MTESDPPIDLNMASAADLQRLPGIGPTLAQRIIGERQRRPFQSVDDLDRVTGIGMKTIEKLRRFAAVGNSQISIRAD